MIFETLSRDSGWVNITGTLISSDGTPLRLVSTIHDGMGSFQYTPTDKPAKVEFMYSGKKRTFKLPAAEKSGYNIILSNKESEFDVTISRNATFITISAETIAYGQPAALNINSIQASKGSATLTPSVR